MDMHQILISIKNFIPEFNGENKSQNKVELSRFIGMADILYDTLTKDEKIIFDKLIKCRLTGEAYSRICDTQIKDYNTLKTTLNNMYHTTQTLEQLETNYKNIRQAYGETIRNYGYRLNEAAIKYKNGYKTKYGLAEIDVTYNNHIERNLVKNFKIGLNNSLLREKVATNEAQNIDKIINETEIIDHMLSTVTEQPTTRTETMQYENYMNKPTCSYCQKPYHTWNVCRTRIFNETQQQNTQYRPHLTYEQNSYQNQNTIQNPNFPRNTNFQQKQIHSILHESKHNQGNSNGSTQQ